MLGHAESIHYKHALLERDEITHKYFGPYHLNIFHIKNKSTHPSVKTCKLYKLALDSDAFHIETSYLICTANDKLGWTGLRKTPQERYSGNFEQIYFANLESIFALNGNP